MGVVMLSTGQSLGSNGRRFDQDWPVLQFDVQDVVMDLHCGHVQMGNWVEMGSCSRGDRRKKEQYPDHSEPCKPIVTYFLADGQHFSSDGQYQLL